MTKKTYVLWLSTIVLALFAGHYAKELSVSRMALKPLTQSTPLALENKIAEEPKQTSNSTDNKVI